MNVAPKSKATAHRRFGLAAFGWSLAFGLISIYWAIGGDLGSNQLAPELQEQAKRRDTGFVAILWITGLLKIAGGLIPLSLSLSLWTAIPRKLLLILTWVGGILLALYGLGDIVGGTIRAAGGEGGNAIWYAVLWGPIWFLGGVLFLGTALTRSNLDGNQNSGESPLRRT
jgi:hypothetical protein